MCEQKSEALTKIDVLIAAIERLSAAFEKSNNATTEVFPLEAGELISPPGAVININLKTDQQ